VNDRNGAEALRGTELYVARENMPPLKPGEYYYDDLVGMRVTTGQTVGNPIVIAVHNFGAGDILELDNGDMVPLTGASVDLGKREIKLEQ
jgi:16S rRNA processing protein RimM